MIVEDGGNGQPWKEDIFKLQCHTQAVERMVKLVTEVSIKVADELRRDGYIRAVLQSRSEMPKFDKKSQFQM